MSDSIDPETAKSQVPLDADARWLRAKRRPRTRTKATRTIRVVDLFSGCGGMSLGLAEAGRRLGYSVEIALAVDFDATATDVYADNFPKALVRTDDVSRLFDGSLGSEPTQGEQAVQRMARRVDVLVAGPPCQGHSDLNNHTRRSDPKNALYLTVARAAEILRPTVVIIENVPAVRLDAEGVVSAASSALESAGYLVQTTLVDAYDMGVPQRRVRFLLIASLDRAVDPRAVIRSMTERSRPRRDVRWAIGDLLTINSADDLDRPSTMSSQNTERVAHLFANDVYELPDAQRPPCHREKPHSYVSVYGRLRWERPSQTITTGFTSMGQGRYVHPAARRTLTPHEAARLQTFPDWFKWDSAKKQRGKLAVLIGNAVPPLMVLFLGMTLLPRLRIGEDGENDVTASTGRGKPPTVIRGGKEPHVGGSSTGHRTRAAARGRTSRTGAEVPKRHRTPARVAQTR